MPPGEAPDNGGDTGDGDTGDGDAWVGMATSPRAGTPGMALHTARRSEWPRAPSRDRATVSLEWATGKSGHMRKGTCNSSSSTGWERESGSQDALLIYTPQGSFLLLLKIKKEMNLMLLQLTLCPQVSLSLLGARRTLHPMVGTAPHHDNGLHTRG